MAKTGQNLNFFCGIYFPYISLFFIFVEGYQGTLSRMLQYDMLGGVYPNVIPRWSFPLFIGHDEGPVGWVNLRHIDCQ